MTIQRYSTANKVPTSWRSNLTQLNALQSTKVGGFDRRYNVPEEGAREDGTVMGDTCMSYPLIFPLFFGARCSIICMDRGPKGVRRG